MYASYSSSPSTSGRGRRRPVGLSPQPQQAGSWCGGIRTALIPTGLKTPRSDPSCKKSVTLRPQVSASAEPAALVVRPEEVLTPRGRHRGAGGDLERERRRRHDLREAVHLPGPRAADRLEPGVRVRKRRAAADRSDLEP